VAPEAGPHPSPDAPSRGPLHGVRVVALEQAVAAPLCTRHLADLGADVVKIERPDGGDFARHYDAAVHGESAYFVWLNRGKRSVALDLGSADGRAVFERLLGTADVLVHNLGPGAIERLGFGEDRLRARWPRLISCAISGFGGDGPFRDHKAFDLLVQGESGLVSVTGPPDQPSRVGISIADIAAGMYALASILAALVERQETGTGRALEVAMLDALAEWMAVPALYERYAGGTPRGAALRHPTIAPYGSYETVDGRSILVAVQNDAQWRRFCALVLELPAAADDPRFSSNPRRVANRDELEAMIGDRLGRLDRSSLVARLERADVPFGSVNGVGDLIAHPQLAARGRWIEVATPSGVAILPRSPLDGVARGGSAGAAGAAAPEPGPVPSAGEHTAEVLHELGLRS
jgi:itaconate CoA-transferase